MTTLLTTLNSKYIHSNLAVRILYWLNRSHEGLSWKEFTIKENRDQVAAYCAQYDVVAFSCYIWNITPTLEVCEKIKAINPDTKILLGGPEVSYEWQEIIALPYVDFIITGEGEIPFAEFLASYPEIDMVSNLVRKQGEAVMYRPVNQTFDLKQFESFVPYALDEGNDLSGKVLYIETSRGCPYKCSFCLASLDNKVRYLPEQQIKANLLHMMQHGKVIKFLDRTFNIKKDFTIDIFRFILNHHRPGNVFQFEITADIVHPDIIRFIHDEVPPGLFRFEIGIQTVNQQANLAVSRKQNFDTTRGIIQQLQDKVEMHLDLIVGLPLDRWDDIRYSFEEVFKLFAPELQLGFLKFLKGTPVRDTYEEHHYVFDPMPPYQIIQSDYLSKDELARIVLLEHALEIYWNRKRAIHTLKYITTRYAIFDFLCGLGEYFGRHTDFHKHTLADIYRLLNEFAASVYPDDIVLRQLIMIDYCLYPKIKPSTRFLQDADKALQWQVIDEWGLDHHRYRYIMLPLDFQYHAFSKDMRLVMEPDLLVIQYDGQHKPMICSKPLQFADKA